jgi:hypothetical protein
MFMTGGDDSAAVSQAATLRVLNALSVAECLQPELCLSRSQNGPLYVLRGEHPPSCTARGRTMM